MKLILMLIYFHTISITHLLLFPCVIIRNCLSILSVLSGVTQGIHGNEGITRSGLDSWRLVLFSVEIDSAP